jgi:hypothetical protein
VNGSNGSGVWRDQLQKFLGSSSNERVKGMPSQEIPYGHMDCFKLKPLEEQ